MKYLVSACFFLGCFISAQAEVIYEFDGERWKNTEKQEISAIDISQQEHCFIADSKTKMRQTADLVSKFDKLHAHTTRFALRGEEGNGGILKAWPAETKPSPLMVVVTCDPRGIDVGCIRSTEESIRIETFQTGRMSVDYEGLEKFIAVVKSGVKQASVEKVPAFFTLNLRSETSWGQMVRMIQLLRSVGCENGIIRIDDQFGGFDFEAKQDDGTKPPLSKKDEVMIDKQFAIPSNIKSNQPKPVRIIVNILENGTIKSENGKVIETDKDLSSYIKQAKELATVEGRPFLIFLRGDQDTLSKYSLRVVKLAKDEGVSEVIYAGYKVQKTTE